MRKIVITGPESSGKTTLSMALAIQMKAAWVKEQARPYLEQTGGKYTEEDLVSIAQAQIKAEDEVNVPASGLVVCDTDLITIRIWSQERYERCDPWIIHRTEDREYSHWFLCRPDFPWESDPLRENPTDRDRLFKLHEKMLRTLGKPYTILSGGPVERLAKAKEVIATL
jgi:NadR type nicotinamide-nucleotide adenylyltransferase